MVTKLRLLNITTFERWLALLWYCKFVCAVALLDSLYARSQFFSFFHLLLLHVLPSSAVAAIGRVVTKLGF